jgi:hypothetical protein
MICRHICKNFSTSQQENSSEGIDEKGIDCLTDLFERYPYGNDELEIRYLVVGTLYFPYAMDKITI